MCKKSWMNRWQKLMNLIERLDLSDVPQGQSVMDAGHLTGSISYTTFQEDEPEILYHGLPKCALLSFEVELMSVEDVQYPYHNGMVFLLCLATENEDVIHVMTTTPSSMSSLKMLFIIIWNVAGLLVRPKNMTRGSNRPLFILEGRLPLISILDSNIVVSPLDVQFW